MYSLVLTFSISQKIPPPTKITYGSVNQNRSFLLMRVNTIQFTLFVKVEFIREGFEICIYRRMLFRPYYHTLTPYQCIECVFDPKSLIKLFSRGTTSAHNPMKQTRCSGNSRWCKTQYLSSENFLYSETFLYSGTFLYSETFLYSVKFLYSETFLYSVKFLY